MVQNRITLLITRANSREVFENKHPISLYVEDGNLYDTPKQKVESSSISSISSVSTNKNLAESLIVEGLIKFSPFLR
jgi:hypothetical protein